MKFVVKALVYIVVMNAAMPLGAGLLGGDLLPEFKSSCGICRGFFKVNPASKL